MNSVALRLAERACIGALHPTSSELRMSESEVPESNDVELNTNSQPLSPSSFASDSQGGPRELLAEFDDILEYARGVSGVGNSGDLSSSAIHQIGGPGVDIHGVGLLPLPVNAHQASILPKSATIGDSISNEWFFEPTALRFENPAWQGSAVPRPLLDAIAEDLTLPAGAICFTSLRGLFVTGPRGNLAQHLRSLGSGNSERRAGRFGTLVVVLSSKWTGGELTVQRGSATSSLSCEPALCFGGSLQHLAFFADAELTGTPVTSGFLSTVVYDLYLKTAAGDPIPFAPPTWLKAVRRLTMLLRSWKERLSVADVGAPTDAEPAKQRALILLEQTFSGVPSAGALEGGDRSVCSLLRSAIEGCDDVGAYLAVFQTTERLTASSLQDRGKYNRYGRYGCGYDSCEDEEHDVHEYDWEVESKERKLCDWVDLRSGLVLKNGPEHLQVDGDDDDTGTVNVVGFAVLHNDRTLDVDCVDPTAFTLDDDDGDCASGRRVYRSAVLVLDFSFDPWRDFCRSVGVDAAAARLQVEMSSAGMWIHAPGGCEGDAGAHLIADKLPRVVDVQGGCGDAGGLGPSNPSRGPLKAALVARGPLDIASTLWDSFATTEQQAGKNVPLPLIAAILSCPRSSSRVRLISRLLQAVGSRLVNQDSSTVAAMLDAVAGNQGPVDALCNSLRAARISAATRTFSEVLNLARLLLRQPLVAVSADFAEPPVNAGMKRRRQEVDVSGASVSEAVALGSWRADAGRSVLISVARTFTDDGSAECGSGVSALISLMRMQCLQSEVEFIVTAKLRVLVNCPASLTELLMPQDDFDAARRIGDAVLAGIPALARCPQPAVRLLALSRLVVALDGAVPAAAVTAVVAANDALPTAGISAQCEHFSSMLPSTPVEPTFLELSTTNVSKARLDALDARILCAPVQSIVPGLTERVLQEVARAWPKSTQIKLSDGETTSGVFLALLLSRSLSVLAGDFVARHLFDLIPNAPTLRFLMKALFAVGQSTPMTRALWAGVIRGLPDVFNTDVNAPSIYSSARLDRSVPAALVGIFLDALVAHAKSKTRPGTDMNLTDLSRLIGAVVDKWPIGLSDDRSNVSARAVLNALILVADAATAEAFLQRMSAKALLSCVEPHSKDGLSTAATAIITFGWSPFGEALGRAVTKAVGLGSTAQESEPPCDLAVAVHAGTFLLRAVVSACEAFHTTFGAAARAVVAPLFSAVADAALGVRRIRFVTLSENGCSNLVSFLHNRHVINTLHAKYPMGLPAAWIRHISTKGVVSSSSASSLYSMASLASFVEKALQKSASVDARPTHLVHLLQALISIETTRLAEPFPPLGWARSPICTQCTINPHGPSSCDRINAFLADPLQNTTVITFSNLSKARHVHGYLKRQSTFQTELSGYQLKVVKLTDSSAASAHAAAAARYAADRTRLTRLETIERQAAKGNVPTARGGHVAASLDLLAPASSPSPSPAAKAQQAVQVIEISDDDDA